LAELARLIGQDDPFADFRDDQRGTPRPAGNGNAPRNGRDRHDQEQEDYDDNAAYAREPARSRRIDEPRLPDGSAARKNGRAGAYAYGGGREVSRQRPDDHYAPQPTAKRPSPQPDYDERDADYEDPRYARGARGNGYADPHQDQDYEQGPYDREDESVNYEPEYEGDQYAGEYDDQAYVEPASGRRWIYIGAAAAVALLVLGGAGVYGYRALFGKHTGGTPPTIRPADAPTKVAPQASTQTGEGGQKLIYDRLDGPKQGERIVPREEQPADVAQNTGRVVTAPQSAGQVTAFAPVPGVPQNAPAAITGPAPAQTLPSTEPRKVRTTTVRSDGTIVDTPRPTAAQQRSAQSQQPQPLALNPYAQPAATDPNPDAGGTPGRTAALAPARSSQPAGQQPSNQQPWAVVQPPAVTAPPPAQQTSNYVPAGSYVVQVAAQKTEADARASWQQLQAKYSNVFGNYQATIKRVDLGDRGTFYRAMLGPFANRDQAYEMCQNLKAAGGECIVQRN